MKGGYTMKKSKLNLKSSVAFSLSGNCICPIKQ